MSKAHKPKDDHPWKRGWILNREVSEHIKQSTTVARVNNWKVGGGMTPWNGRK